MHKAKKLAAVAAASMMAFSMVASNVFAKEPSEDPVRFDAERSGYNAETKRYEMYYIIDENTDADAVTVNFGDDWMRLVSANERYLSPGGKYQADIHIENDSTHTYAYQSGGLSVNTPALASDHLSPFFGFDGKQIPFDSVIVMTPDDKVLRDLYGKKSFTVEDLLGIYDVLAAKGYTGDEALTEYTLDYYRQKDGVNYADWNDFMAQKGPSYANDFGVSYNGIYTVDKTTLDALLAKYPKMAPFVRMGDETNGKVEIQIVYPEEALAVTHYAYFYKDLFALGFSPEVCDQMNPNGTGVNFTRTLGLGDYLDHSTDPYMQADAYISGLKNADGLSKGESLGDDGIRTAFTLDGPGMGNGYQNYAFGFDLSITLSRIDTTYTIEHQYYTKTDDGEYEYDGSVTLDPVEAVIGDQIDLDTIERLLSYNGNTYACVTNGGTLTLTNDAQANHIVIEYRREVKSETPQDPQEQPQDPQTPSKEDGAVQQPTAEEQVETAAGNMQIVWELAVAFGGIGLIAILFRRRA